MFDCIPGGKVLKVYLVKVEASRRGIIKLFSEGREVREEWLVTLWKTEI